MCIRDRAYTAETGVPVTVVTAASGEYETTLMAEMGKSEAPTLFQVNGPVGRANWKDYCYDLSGSDIYTQLTSAVSYTHLCSAGRRPYFSSAARFRSYSRSALAISPFTCSISSRRCCTCLLYTSRCV